MRRRTVVWIAVGVAAAVVVAGLIVRAHRWRLRPVVIQGAVIRNDPDPRRQLPIAGASVSATDSVNTVGTIADSSGYFRLRLMEGLWPQQKVLLNFRATDYNSLDIPIVLGLRSTGSELYIGRMQPLLESGAAPSDGPQLVVSNIRIRYTVNSQTEENIGSAVKTFQVENQGNVPCNHREPCSPEGAWKGASGSVTLDAGAGNEFRNARASCIAGPCPFTRIDSSGLADGNRIITASALDWSGTTTFLVEAEVFHAGIDSLVRSSYPVIFGRALNFTLPATQEGVSIEAEINGQPMVFPLGPELRLSWATCTERNSKESDRSMAYLCELNPGYRF